MAEKSLYYPDTQQGDIQQIHPDGGGIIMKKEFKAIIGETNSEVVTDLNENFYRGEVLSIPNNVDGLWVMSERSFPLQGSIKLGNENKESILEQNPLPIEDIPLGDCDGVGFDLYKVNLVTDEVFQGMSDPQFKKLANAFSNIRKGFYIDFFASSERFQSMKDNEIFNSKYIAPNLQPLEEVHLNYNLSFDYLISGDFQTPSNIIIPKRECDFFYNFKASDNIPIGKYEFPTKTVAENLFVDWCSVDYKSPSEGLTYNPPGSLNRQPILFTIIPNSSTGIDTISVSEFIRNIYGNPAHQPSGIRPLIFFQKICQLYNPVLIYTAYDLTNGSLGYSFDQCFTIRKSYKDPKATFSTELLTKTREEKALYNYDNLILRRDRNTGLGLYDKIYTNDEYIKEFGPPFKMYDGLSGYTAQSENTKNWLINNYPKIIDLYNQDKKKFVDKLYENLKQLININFAYYTDHYNWYQSRKSQDNGKTTVSSFYSAYLSGPEWDAIFENPNSERITKLKAYFNEFLEACYKISLEHLNCSNPNNDRLLNLLKGGNIYDNVTTVSSTLNINNEDKPEYKTVDTNVSNDVIKEIIKTPVDSTSPPSNNINNSSVPDNNVQSTPPPPPPQQNIPTTTNQPLPLNEKQKQIINQTIQGDSGQSSAYSEEEGLYKVDFNNIPDYDSFFNSELYNPDGEINYQSIPTANDYQNYEVIYASTANEGPTYQVGATVSINVGTSGGGGGGSSSTGTVNLNLLTKTGAISDPTVLQSVMTIKNGANNVAELAIRENPENFPSSLSLPNPSLPRFLKSDLCKTDPVTQNPILVAIGNIMGPYNGLFGRDNLWCASGVSSAYVFFNSTEDQLKVKSTTSAGGFPASPSSFIVPTKTFSKPKESFIYNVDFISDGSMTSSGLNKWNNILAYKGAIFTVGNASQGHIGMILYLAYDGRYYNMYTIEWNVSHSLKFLHRRFGDNWGAWSGGAATNIYIGDTGGFTGGDYASNGLGSDYSLAGIGSVKSFYTTNKFR